MASLNNEDLIGAVFAKRCLWDQQDKFYHNRHVLDKNWTEIAKALKQDAVCLKKKWKQLRDTFRNELKKIPAERSGDAGPDKVNALHSQWAHFQSMMFVKEQFKCRKSSGNLCQQQSSEAVNFNDDDKSNICMEMSQEDGNRRVNLNESNVSIMDVETHPSWNTRSNLKRRHEGVETEITSIEKKKLELMEQKSYHEIQSDDEDMAFFVSLLPYVKKMDPQTKLLCRMDMQSCVYNHAFTNVHSFSQNPQLQNRRVSIPSPSPIDSASTQFSDNVKLFQQLN